MQGKEEKVVCPELICLLTEKEKKEEVVKILSPFLHKISFLFQPLLKRGEGEDLERNLVAGILEKSFETEGKACFVDVCFLEIGDLKFYGNSFVLHLFIHI